jgi:hypothetical protein
MGILEVEEETLIPLTDDVISVCSDIQKLLPKTIKRRLSRQLVPPQLEQYINILFKDQDTISIDKYNLGVAKNYRHQIYLKMNDLVYRKQFQILEVHHQFIEQTLKEWLKLGVVEKSYSLNNSLIFCVPKNQGQGLHISRSDRQYALITDTATGMADTTGGWGWGGSEPSLLRWTRKASFTPCPTLLIN